MRRELQAAGTTLATLSLGVVTELVGNTVRLASTWTPTFWLIVVQLIGLLVWLALRKERGPKPDDLNAGMWSNPADTAANTMSARGGACRRFEWQKQVRRASTYQERTASTRLGAALAAEGIAVLYGMGGVGKTQVAAAYARECWEPGGVDVWWVDGRSRTEVLAAIRELEQPTTTGRRRLIIFDDLPDPQELKNRLPHHLRLGQIIVTTRRRGDGIEVKPFTPDEARRFLTRRLTGRQSEGAEELAEALGNLPKALAEAAAHIADNVHLTCTSYLDLLNDPDQSLSQLRPDHLPDGQRDTMANMWSHTIEQANRSTPKRLSGPVLALASLLDHRGVPEQVFVAATKARYLPAASGRSVTVESVKRALSCLHRLNLLTYDPGDPYRAVRVHPVVQRAVYAKLRRQEIRLAALTAAAALSHAWPSIERDHELAEVLRDNVATLRQRAGTHLWHPLAHEVLFRPGHSLGACGQEAAAEGYFRNLVEIARKHLVTGTPRPCVPAPATRTGEAKQATCWAPSRACTTSARTCHGGSAASAG
jgi:hypothetical protein